MSRAVLRSIAAILLGWLVTVGGYLVTMVVIALFDREAFQPGVHHSVGYWLLTLSVGLIYSVVGGFVTGIIARRREIAHAIGLVVFGLLISKCWPKGHAETMPAPNWYWIAGYILTPLSTMLGGWLRMKQRILLSKGSARMARATDHVRILTAIFVAFGTFVVVMYLTGALAVAGLAPILDRLGGDPIAPVMLPCFLAFLLSVFLARYVFRKIAGERASCASGGGTNNGTED